jgi:hypothetical protein
MNRVIRYRFALMSAAAAASAALAASGASRDYDVQHQAQASPRSAQAQPSAQGGSQGDARQDRAYRRYLKEQSLPYQDFSHLTPEQQNSFLQWFHDHPDAGD